MRQLEARVPPPIVMLGLMAAAFGIAAATPALTAAPPFKATLSMAAGLSGLALNLAPKIAFRRARTTVNPLRPSATTHLVTSGIYRYTRNPMYLGHALILLGWVLYLGNAMAYAVVPVFIALVSHFQIAPEERALGVLFPEYADYRRRVRRWL